LPYHDWDLRLIAANAAEEEVAAKPRARITPYWRTLKTGGILNEKYPGGVEQQRARLEAEGHTIVAKGKKVVVVDHEKKLFEF
jgi:alkylated DNA nucleotide flippase Atl1